MADGECARYFRHVKGTLHRLACGLLAANAASMYELGSYGFRIGVITTPEEGHGRALSLSWKDTDRELRISSKSVRGQPFNINLELRAAITESTIGRRAIAIMESENRTPLEEAWVRALFWYSDGHRDQTPVMISLMRALLPLDLGLRAVI